METVHKSMKSLLKRFPIQVVEFFYISGVCTRCCFRILELRDHVYSLPLPSLKRLLVFKTPCGGEDILNTSEPCIICLGILEDIVEAQRGSKSEDPPYSDLENSTDKETEGFTGAYLNNVLESVSLGGHQHKSFCLEVTLPAIIAVRERAFCQSLGQRFRDHPLLAEFKQTNHSPPISLKEALKWTLVEPLSQRLGVPFDSSSDFRIALFFAHSSSSVELEAFGNISAPSSKRKRNGPYWHSQKGAELDNSSGVLGDEADETGESSAALQRILSSMGADEFSKLYPWPPPQLMQPCSLKVKSWRSSVYIGGRYLKYLRNISQSPWVVDDERMGDGSVQEIIGDVVFPHFEADSYKFQAAGREDIDVRMLGNGRPFLMEVINARKIPSPEAINELAEKINTSDKRQVGVRSLQVVDSKMTAVMREGESDKQKVYRAIVWISRDATDSDMQELRNRKELVLQQMTPIRVLHRRSPLVRPRTIHSMSGDLIPGKPNFFVLHLTTQAGTYVKEFVHGDFGRTEPSIGTILGCEADILGLDVMDIKMDFL